MRICDVCKLDGIQRIATEFQTVIGSVDLCDFHNKQLDDIYKFALSVFRTTKSDAELSDVQCREWAQRLVQTKAN